MPINSFLYPGAKSPTPGYEVDNSCRFNAADSPYFARATSASGNQRKFTISVWLKMDIHASGASHFIFDTGDSADYFKVYFTTEPYLKIVGRISNSNVLELIPSKGFRDPTAWFHLYIAVDTTQGTASNRVKVYINGVQETSFGTATYPNQNTDFVVNDTNEPIEVGINSGHSSGESYDGYMAEYVFVDGAAQAISDFGEFDEDSPTIWKPKDVSGIAVNPDGANGFYLDFKDSSNLGNDAAGGTDFDENNIVAADQATDTPTNNFCTVNPLDQYGSYTLSEGNCQISSGHTSWYTIGSTMAVSNGKWYWETEFDAGTMIEIFVGVHDTSVDRTGTNAWLTGSSLFYNDAGGEIRKDGTNSTEDYGTLTAGDILGIALNMDDKQITLYKNGSAIASNVALSTSISEAMPTFLTDSNDVVFKVNFGGCPSFAISSGNTDGNGYGNFEFSVPSNYYSLCTKNLAEYG